MAALATALTEFADNGNSRIFVLPGHTALKPRLVIQKRTVATNGTSSPEDTIDVVYGTTDSAGLPLAGRVAFSIKVRRPVNGQASDVTGALAVTRDIVQSDEFETMVTTQRFLK